MPNCRVDNRAERSTIVRATLVTGRSLWRVCSSSRNVTVRCMRMPGSRARRRRGVLTSVVSADTFGNPHTTAAVVCEATASPPAASTAAMTDCSHVAGAPATA
jgi:hypothetical protein